MTPCIHVHLTRLGGTIHAEDRPPTYQCEECKGMYRALIMPDEIVVRFGTKDDPKS